MKLGTTKILIIGLIVIALWFPRGLALDRFLTADEPRWLIRSANFYTALSQADFPNTYQKEHPGVTIMWAGTLAFRWIFPWYISENLGQIDRTQDFTRLLNNRGYSDITMRLMEMGRTIIVIIMVIALALAFLAAVRLLGLMPASFGFLLIAFDPFSIALSRLLHLDALLSALMLLSLLSFMNYLYRGRHFYDLVIAAVAAGLAWLTKSPSLFLLPFFGLLILIEIGRTWWTHHRLSLQGVWHHSWPLLAWIGIATVVFILLWPAMWVDPIGSVQKICYLIRFVVGCNCFTIQAEAKFSKRTISGCPHPFNICGALYTLHDSRCKEIRPLPFTGFCPSGTGGGYRLGCDDQKRCQMDNCQTKYASFCPG